MITLFRSVIGFVALVALSHWALPGRASAWFDKGHRVVGLIAAANLTAAARSEVKKILDGMTLADAAIWPDHEGRSIRDFDPLHYVTHLVGDMHQPLHAGRAQDSAGTGIRVSYRSAETNLHFFWDMNLVEMESGTAEEVARRLAANITNEERSAWRPLLNISVRRTDAVDMPERHRVVFFRKLSRYSTRRRLSC